MRFDRSDELRKRAHDLIPGGAHTYSKGDDQFPQRAPGFIARGKGSRVWDVDGNEFIDWGMGLRSVLLGHAYEPVLDEVREQLALGSNFTRPSPIEAEVAERLSRLVPSAQMVKFAKNGSDATSAAVRLSRAFTGRDLVARCAEHPFFSVDDWFIGSTEMRAGVPQAVQALTKTFHYNRLDTLERLFEEHPDRIACVVLECATTEPPAPGFLEGVRDLARRHGAILVFDEIITGFRWHASGAQAFYGVTPDLSTFGKALGNGFSVSALVGRRDVMERGGLHHDQDRVFLLSTTHGGETHALAAARATLRTVAEEDVVGHVWRIGERLQDGLRSAARAHGLDAHVKVSGYPCSPLVSFVDGPGAPWHALRALFLQETIQEGVLIPYVAPSFSHTDEDVDATVAAADKAFAALARAAKAGTTDGLLHGPATKPVFRRRN